MNFCGGLDPMYIKLTENLAQCADTKLTRDKYLYSCPGNGVLKRIGNEVDTLQLPIYLKR